MSYASSSDSYKLNKTVAASRARVKPNELVVCTRCPLGMWINNLKILGTPSNPKADDDTDYGVDHELRCKCAAWGTEMWPKYNVGDCSAGRDAIRAEREQGAGKAA